MDWTFVLGAALAVMMAAMFYDAEDKTGWGFFVLLGHIGMVVAGFVIFQAFVFSAACGLVTLAVVILIGIFQNWLAD